MSDYLSVVQSQFHEWMDYLGMPAAASTTPIYAIAGLAGVAVAAHLFLNSIPGESDLQMISNVDYSKVSLPTSDGRISALCLDGKSFFYKDEIADRLTDSCLNCNKNVFFCKAFLMIVCKL